jgi:hypothetical protein
LLSFTLAYLSSFEVKRVGFLPPEIDEEVEKKAHV